MARYEDCPLGEKCPNYKRGSNRIPQHDPNRMTYKMHKDISEGKVGVPVDPATGHTSIDFLSESELVSSDNSDAVITPDGAISFAKMFFNPKDSDSVAHYIQQMNAEIEAGIDTIVSDPDKMAEYLSFASKAYGYSFRNTMLIALQKPTGGNVFKTAKQWKAEGYQVAAGSSGAKVYRPNTYTIYKKDDDGKYVLDENGKRIVEGVGNRGYSVYSVFGDRDLDPNVKQPPQHPLVAHMNRYQNDTSIEDNVAMKEDLERVAQEHNIAISYATRDDDSSIAGGSAGYTRKDPDTGEVKIVLNSDIAPHAQTTTLAHELGHVFAGHHDDDRDYKNLHDRSDMETEAEVFAYAVAKEYGLDAGEGSFAYLKSWKRKDGEEKKQVERSFAKVTSAMETYFSTLEKAVTGTNQNEKREEYNKKSREEWAKKRKAKKKTTRKRTRKS